MYLQHLSGSSHEAFHPCFIPKNFALISNYFMNVSFIENHYFLEVEDMSFEKADNVNFLDLSFVHFS